MQGLFGGEQETDLKSSLGAGREQRQVEWVRPWRVVKEEGG